DIAYSPRKYARRPAPWRAPGHRGGVVSDQPRGGDRPSRAGPQGRQPRRGDRRPEGVGEDARPAAQALRRGPEFRLGREGRRRHGVPGPGRREEVSRTPATPRLKGAGYYDRHSKAQTSSIEALQDWVDDAVPVAARERLWRPSRRPHLFLGFDLDGADPDQI